MQVECAVVAIQLAHGARVRNTWAICPSMGNNSGKPKLIPHNIPWTSVRGLKAVRLRRRCGKSGVKSMGLTHRLLPKLPCLSVGEARGIAGVAVKCVDICRNTRGESGALDHY